MTYQPLLPSARYRAKDVKQFSVAQSPNLPKDDAQMANSRFFLTLFPLPRLRGAELKETKLGCKLSIGKLDIVSIKFRFKSNYTQEKPRFE